MEKALSSKIPGINIQFPISQLITSGQKTIETRTYPLPDFYLNRDLLLVETPGSKGTFVARGVAVILFDKCFKYRSKAEFYLDFDRHRVEPGSPWAWDPKKPKWGWTIAKLRLLDEQQVLNGSRGIRYTRSIAVDFSL